ncbi:unnamed protein product, partial [Ectocarpus sp. 13 AM-2016]
YGGRGETKRTATESSREREWEERSREEPWVLKTGGSPSSITASEEQHSRSIHAPNGVTISQARRLKPSSTWEKEQARQGAGGVDYPLSSPGSHPKTTTWLQNHSTQVVGTNRRISGPNTIGRTQKRKYVLMYAVRQQGELETLVGRETFTQNCCVQ